MLLVAGILKTEAPLSIAMPIAEGGRENAYGQFPVMTRGVDEDGNKLETGYLPATTLRGFMRVVPLCCQICKQQPMLTNLTACKKRMLS